LEITQECMQLLKRKSGIPNGYIAYQMANHSF
jgi:hypothetical protein